MADASQRPIVIKKIKKGGHGHHGGAWKIAYADFVTAMMAFFLLMWLLGSTAKGDLQGISEFFQNPLKVSLSGGDGAGDATAMIKGGGQDLAKSAGQVKRGERDKKTRTDARNESRKSEDSSSETEKQKDEIKAGKDKNSSALMARKALEKEKLKALSSELDEMLKASDGAKNVKDQMAIDMTKDGLRIQIIDENNNPMFSSGRAEPLPHMKKILKELGAILKSVDNPISIAGHTDSEKFSNNKEYSNWELSTDRANASRRELISGGLPENQIYRIIGLADSSPLKPTEPNNPTNRRISILIMNRENMGPSYK